MGCQICSQATFLQMIGYNVLIDGFKKKKKEWTRVQPFDERLGKYKLFCTLLYSCSFFLVCY